ncbi:PorV/PorQ family protein [Candidatus Marinimicrobia bacterium]|nr:PorV/PorQ family protein [Candidatus Neomarinimicrobiota bacterium]MDC0383355.1 PorV/PorQ family protein [Candidatus Neomarinimicrobiota bacterium]MDC0630663.1 PorV/PorQ family protein [Candidatus Neomarinimicrobiota bacterium]
MKRLGIVLSVMIVLNYPVLAQSEAGAIFLLIAPGARAGGMGEAQTAVANDAYASYWNPAGLGFLEGKELALMHVNWLPGLADDLYYEFFAFRKKYPTLGTLGGHLIFLNLGEQIRTSETGDELGTFTSYMTAFSLSYSALISRTQSFGINSKISYQHLVEIGAGAEKGKGTSIDFGFDLGYMHKEWLSPNLTLGLNLSNLGPKVSFIDPDQADPQPTNLSIGFNYAVINSEFNKLNVVYDVDKLLVSSYPDMDWDGDGYIGGFDEDGNQSAYNDYNSDGQIEIAHTDPIYKAIFTSWANDWILGGDIDYGSSSPGNGDGIIGGYEWVDGNGDGKIDGTKWYDSNGNESLDPGEGEMIASEGEPGDEGWGKYNEYGIKEKGNAKDRKLSDELDRLVHNIGMEYWYGQYFAIRSGFIYDKTGKISNPTFGIGLRFSGYGFDFGYTYGETGHPLTNTMRFSLNMEF